MAWTTALALTAGALKATGDVVSGISDAQAIDAQTDEFKLNAQQARYAAAQAYQEGAMAVNQTTDSARKEIASGVAGMSAAGNIGTSAQAAIVQAYSNLSKDISAINYKYGNEAIQHKNRAAALEYSAKVSESNRKNRVLSSWIKAGASVVDGFVKAAYLGGAGGGYANTGPAYGSSSTVGIGGVPMYGGSL